MVKRLFTGTAMAAVLAAPMAVQAGTPGTTAQEDVSESTVHSADQTYQSTQASVDHTNASGVNAPHPLFVDEQPEPERTAKPAPEPEPQPEPEPEQTVETEPETPEQVAQTTVYFDLDESHLRNRGERKIDRIADRAETADGVRVKGYTDTTASESYNWDLSNRRADSVSAALRAEGVAGQKISKDWFGENRLAEQTADGVLEQDNRRAAVVVMD
jgi:outer membrane protein OmpA-like peptidoglycan-associated protein